MKKIKQIILMIGIITMNAACASTDYNQPLYSLEFKIYGTGAEIRLNDIPIHSQSAQGETSSQKPIPESILDGENILTVKSFPLDKDSNKYEENAYIEATITIREKDAPLNQNKPVLQLKINPNNPDNSLFNGTLSEIGDTKEIILTRNDKQILVERRTNIKSPFPRWAWQDGLTIENNTENFDSLLEEYKKIWLALNSNEIKNVTPLYDLAAQEFATAYHYNDKQQGHRIMNTGGLIGDDEWKLGSIDNFLKKFTYHIEIHANGKMAQLIDEKNRSPIVYLSRKAKIINVQKFSFYKNKNNEWMMIR